MKAVDKIVTSDFLFVFISHKRRHKKKQHTKDGGQRKNIVEFLQSNLEISYKSKQLAIENKFP